MFSESAGEHIGGPMHLLKAELFFFLLSSETGVMVVVVVVVRRVVAPGDFSYAAAASTRREESEIARVRELKGRKRVRERERERERDIYATTDLLWRIARFLESIVDSARFIAIARFFYCLEKSLL